ncbi:MAG: gas vesicle protein GvpK [Legionellales bacterium RIFCSPHIGHO2_12_FULL_42_9]|nr:MAG: gas vesicle protein GvpK [Legionellales bacterium RIFCSPHIGHO2_12_FULL_42_9]
MTNHPDQTEATAQRINLQPDAVKNGLGKLVLVLIRLIHELLERQAISRIQTGNLSELQIEQLGITLMQQAEEIDKLREFFGLTKDELNLDLGVLGKLI